MLNFLEHESELVRMWATWVIASAVQNNPWAQERALQMVFIQSFCLLRLPLSRNHSKLDTYKSLSRWLQGTLEKLEQLIRIEDSDKVLSKAIPALSGLLRDNPKAEEEFLKHEGIRLLGSVIIPAGGSRQISDATRMKATFLLSYLLYASQKAQEQAREVGK